MTRRTRSSQVQGLFDRKSAEWSGKYAAGGALEARRKAFVDVAQRIAHKGRVLELGCGAGDLASALADRGFAVVGADFSAGMIAQAKQRHAGDPRLEWVTLPEHWETLPFQSERFSLVTASSVLEYVERPDVVFREVARVLTPGGNFICTVPNRSHWIRRIESGARPLAAILPAEFLPQSVADFALYLGVSRNRYSLERWRGMAAAGGLLAAPDARFQERASMQPLLMLRFSKP